MGRQKTDSARAVTETIKDLESSIAPMLLNLELRTRTLDGLDAEQRAYAERAIQHASRLHQSTEWTDEQLLERLGCSMSTTQLRDFRLPRLKRCEHFLGFVDRLVGCVDTRHDRRAVVLECAKLLRTTGKGSKALEDAFAAGPFPAVKYLELGEVAAAGDVVRRFAGTDPAASDPYAAAPTVHISAPRLGMYLDGQHQHIGPRVFARIGEHIDGCTACRGAVEYRRASRHAGQLHR